MITKPTTNKLYSAELSMAAEILDDNEKTWIANNNRLRIMTTPKDELGSDGVARGFGYDPFDPAIKRLSDMVSEQKSMVDKATKHLENLLKSHPLHEWQQSHRGIGAKQLARLLATIGDPYWNTLYDRPRMVSELWAYCGLHVIPVDAEGKPIDKDIDSDSAKAGVAPRRQRGKKSNWSEDARKRTWLIVQSIIKSNGEPYRTIYDETKDKYAGAVHKVPCIRCGPSGKPALPGSELSKAHIHARGVRAAGKAILKDLWIESERLHKMPESERLHKA